MTTETQTRKLNIRLIAVEIANAIHCEISIHEINRIGRAIFPFQRDSYPNDAITSQRAQLVQDWILSLARYNCVPSERTRLLSKFVDKLARDGEGGERLQKILADNGLDVATLDEECLKRFDSHNFHPAIVQHCRRLFCQGNYFQAVFEAATTYQHLVKAKTKSEKEGESLMIDVWSPLGGMLKRTTSEPEASAKLLNGIKFLSAGLVQAIPNSPEYSVTNDWPMEEHDATDLLAFISFLLRQLDQSEYVP